MIDMNEPPVDQPDGGRGAKTSDRTAEAARFLDLARRHGLSERDGAGARDEAGDSDEADADGDG